MKARNLLITLVLMLLWIGADAQNTSDSLRVVPESVIKFIPFELVESTFMLEWEKINQSSSGSFSIGLGVTSGATYDGTRKGVKGELIKRFYLNSFKFFEPRKDREPYLRGIYGAIFLRGGVTSVEEDFYYYDDFTGNSLLSTNTRKANWIFPGVMVGVTRSFWEVLMLEFYVGAGVRVSDTSDSDPFFADELYFATDVYDIGYNGVAPNIGFKVGLGIH